MADFVDDLNLESGKASNPSSFVDDLDLTEKPKPSLWDRAKSAVGMGEEAPKREMTVNPSSVTAAPQQEPAHGPMTAAVRLIQGVRDQKSEPLLLTKDAAGSAFIRTMSRVPENLLASGVKAAKGQAGVSVVDQDLGNRLVSWVEERNKALAKEYSDKGMISKRDVAELGPNLGFSGISMGAGILGGMGGGVAGSFLPGPGNVAGAVSGSMAASGAAAYRMQTYSAMMDWLTKVNEESIKQTGKPITPAEEKKFKEHFDKLASESGLWEAGPEAVGNVLEIALMAGKGTLPGRLASLLPKGTAGKVVKGVARAAGIVGTEEATETITQHGQHNVEVKAGMSKEPIREWTSGDDLLKSAGDVLPGVLLLSGFMTGGGAIYRKAAGKNKTKQLSSPEELSKPAEVKAEEQPFVDDINISEEEVKPNATAEGKKPEGDIGEHSGTDRVGEAAGSGGSDITEPSGEVKEAPKVEPRRIIDDILKDLDEVLGQQEEIKQAKDAGENVPAAEEKAVNQEVKALKEELAEAETSRTETSNVAPEKSVEPGATSEEEKTGETAGNTEVVKKLAHDWDMANRTHRSDSWFDGANANEESRNGFNEALSEGGDQLQAHGMAKESTLSGAIDNLTNILANGLDRTRRGGVLDTAPLVNRPGEGLVGATATGSAYSEGPFQLVAKKGVMGIRSQGDIAAILVNQEHANMVPALRQHFQSIIPNIIVDSYSNAGKVTKQIATDTRTEATELPAPLPKPPEDSISGKVEAAGEQAEVKNLSESLKEQQQILDAIKSQPSINEEARARAVGEQEDIVTELEGRLKGLQQAQVEAAGEVKEPWQMTREAIKSQNSKAMDYSKTPIEDSVKVGDEFDWEFQGERRNARIIKINNYDDGKTFKVVLSGINKALPGTQAEKGKTISGYTINDLLKLGFHKNIIKQAISEGKPVPPEVLKDYPELAKEAKSAAPEAKESLKRQEYDIIGNPAEDSVIAKAFDLYKKTYGMDSLVIEPVTAPSGKAMFQISAKYPNGNVDGIGTRDDSREVLRSRMINILNSPVAGKARDIGVDVGKTWVEVAADVNEARADKVTQDKMRKEYNQEQYIRRAFRETSDKLTELKIRKKDGLPVDEATIEKAQSAFDKAAKRYNDFYRDSKQSTANTTKAKPVTAEPKANKVIPTTKTAEKNVTTPKEQKKYLLEKIDEALKDAPDVPVDRPYRNTRYAKAEDYDRWAKEDRQLFNEYKEKLGTVVIEVPNDGTFTILNTKTSLENFKKQTSKFPASVIKGVPELKTPMPSKRETGKRLELEGVSYYNDFKPRKQDIIPSDNDAHNYYADGYFTQGHYLVKTERPKGIKISEETNDIKKVIPNNKDLITAEIVAEYNYGGGEREPAKVHVVGENGFEAGLNAHFIDVVLTAHQTAKVFVNAKAAQEGALPRAVVFKVGKDVVGLVMPLQGEVPSAEFIADHQVEEKAEEEGKIELPKFQASEAYRVTKNIDQWLANNTPDGANLEDGIGTNGDKIVWKLKDGRLVVVKGDLDSRVPFQWVEEVDSYEPYKETTKNVRDMSSAKSATMTDEQIAEKASKNKKSKQATPKTETQQPRTWFELGRIVSDKYSNLARGKSTSLKPDDVTLKQVSSEIGITNEDARRALTVYNSSEPREREKNISKPVPKIADTDKSKQKPEPKQPWEMTLDELASQKTNWYAGKQYLIPRDKFIELGIARNYEKRDDGYYGFNYDNNKEYRVDEKILNNMREESAKSHKYYVQKARKEGKEIPEAVLKDYPELKKEEAEKKPNNAGTDDSGAELAYNKRNRIRAGIKWTDIQDKNTALKVKEVTKSNVYPKPDYQQMVADGMHQMSAYLVKTVYDSIPPTPVIGSRTITDEDMQRYITAVNRVMDGVTVWANDKEAIKAWASKQASVAGAMLGRVTSLTDIAKSDKSLLGMVYPDGYKNHMEEIKILGGRSILQGLQPGYEQGKKAIKEIERGWPGKIESWQRQGFAVIERKDIKVPAGWTDSNGKPVYMTEINGRTFGERYGNREDAQAAIDKMQPFILVDKYSRPVSEHETLEEAQEAARGKVKRDGGKTINEKGISVESAERIGEPRRKEGENITSDRLRETFGFKGVNFGNWMKGNANEAERQLHLNHAYDSFMDLAELLNVPPEALSLNGMLGVAIGAQGSGAAAAHFVPGVNEINLTRTAGAGAIAHEWAHALDHYFGTQAGLSAAKHPYLTENKPIGGTIRPEIVTLFDKIVHAINFKTITITPEEQTRQDETRKQQAKGNVESWLKSIRRDYANNGIDEQAFDTIAARINNLDLGDGRVSVSGYFSMSPAVSELRNLYKEKTGRTYSLDQIKGLQTNIDHYKYLSEKDQTDHVPQTRETYSDYALEAGRLDKGKKKDYWNTNREKFARAFDAFITDSISEKEAKNTYLSGIEAAPPKGEERKTINQAFRELVDEIKTRETENGLMLFDNEGNYDIIKAKKAGLVDDETIQRIENYGNEISTSKRGNLDSTVRASKIPADFTKQGFVDLRGQRIESPRDLAAICQIFRDPQVETLRYFYLKDGVIVGHEGISSRMPGFVSFFPTGQFAKNIMKMIGRARRLKADEIYLLHNHPSGVPKPSDEDMQATAALAGNLYLKSKEDGRGTIKLTTHVIIDHKKYGVITAKPSLGNVGNIEGISVNRHVSDLPEGKENEPPSVPHELLGTKIADPSDVANIGQIIKSPKNYATLIFSDAPGTVSGIQDVHVGMLKGKDADGYLRARAREVGATIVYAHIHDIADIGEKRARELITNGSLRDVVWNNQSAFENGMRKRPGYVFGKKISDYGTMRVHEWSNVENLTENQKEARKRIERNLSIMGEEAQKAGVSIEDYMKATGMSEGQVTRLMEYAKAQPVEAPEGYREVLPDEVLPAGSDVNMDFISGKSFVKVKDTTGVKHAVIEEERVKAGKEPVIKQEPRGNEGMFQAAKAAVDSGEIKPRLLAQEVAKKPRPITTEEEFALMYDRMRIKNELRDIQRQIDTAQQDKNSQMEADLLERRTAIESDLDTNDQATTHGGSEVGRSLQARTRMINEDYSLEEILLRARQDNGGTLSEEMRKKYEALAREIEEANEKIKAYEEKIASLEAKRSFQRMKNDDVIIRHLGQAKEKRASAKKALDDEFSQLTKQLNAALGGIHMNFDPTAVKILALMAKNRIKAGILTPDGIVNEIYEQVHESYPEVEKRDIRDAISGYGRTLQLSKDEIDVQLREAKRLMRLISSYEDASSGQVPLRSGMQRDKMTNEVRELGRRVRQAMREAGIDWESSLSPEEQWKTSLDAVKTRLRNQIHDIKQQIETGEKSPKKIGIKYDEEAEALRAQRDKLKDILISIEGKPGMSPEQKINLAMAAVEKSIAEYERRISEKDLAPKKQGTGSPETPELKSLRDRRDELRAIYKEMQKEAKPKKTPEEIALQSYKTRMKNRIKELEEKLEKKDFAEKPKRELRLDDEGLTLKHNLDRAIYKYKEARLKDQLARRNWLQKFGGGIAETANFMRSLKASMDVSAVFRQGLFTVVSHPVVGAKALPAMFKAFKNDKYRFAVEQDILNRPNYKLYKDAGLDLTNIGTDLSKMEETFMSRLAEKIPGVAGSQRAYTTFLNKIRVDTFDLLIKNLVKSEGKHTPEEAKAIATLINESTGRGKVGMKPNTLSGLNTIFFAPRLVASRFQILAGHSMWKGTKASRKLIAKEYGRFLAGMSVVYLLAQLAGSDIEWDPRSSDFGKIKIGNTRIDPMGGFAQVIVFSSRVISGKTKSSSGVIKPIRGDVQYGQGNTADVIWRFLRTKLAPAVSASIDALTGTDVVGNKVTVFNPDELKAPETVTDIPKQIGKVSSLPEKTVAPMAIVDTYEAMRDRGIPQGLAIGALGMLGVGIQTYEKDTKQKLKDDLRDAIKSEDQEAIDTAKEAISDASDNELITERDKKRILKDAKDDAFVSAAKKMPLPALAEMIKEDATDDQKEALHDIFKKKIDRARQERRIDSETQDRYYEILEEMR